MTILDNSTQLQHLLPSSKNGEAVTMSSQDLAEICEKSHAHVLRDIRKMLIDVFGGDKLDEIVPEHYRNRNSEYIRENADAIMGKLFGDDPNLVYPSRGFKWKRDNRGYVSSFALNKDLTVTLITGYRADLRYKVIKRLEELEGKQQSRPLLDFSDPKVMLGVFEHLQCQVTVKENVIVEQGERLKKLDRLEGALGTMCFTDGANTLGIQLKRLTSFMVSRRWIYKRAGNKNWIAFADKLQKGFLEHDEHIYIDGQGNERVSTRALITAKGLVKLAELLEEPVH